MKLRTAELINFAFSRGLVLSAGPTRAVQAVVHLRSIGIEVTKRGKNVYNVNEYPSGRSAVAGLREQQIMGRAERKDLKPSPVFLDRVEDQAVYGSLVGGGKSSATARMSNVRVQNAVVEQLTKAERGVTETGKNAYAVEARK